ncbi:methyltransferase domain-containing protein [Sulfitobacter sp. F26204]|uniref:methyltransferase domain-containing protein n=1 Tax=Sulfitobacter sp. F26204 TaxID=2996014 RepID=UPI00225E3463|nr:methyltransferase domain-containing protein [Sulfitobacter sp. F26204]MCX7558280.1 methyltransferase domain-containing protein [Sulfitobacter sp. F26204]
MTQPVQMTDMQTLARYRHRADHNAMFLHQAAADEVQDRIDMVNMSFNSTALVTGAPDIWSGRHPTAHIVPDAETLTLEVGAHDLVIHAMALHWANDPVGQLVQCRRALKPDGLFLSVAFGGQTLHELRACLGQAEADVTGGLSPRVAPMGDLRDMGGLLQRAGFALPVADSLTYNVQYQDTWDLMRDLRAMGETNALTGRLRRPTRRAVLETAAHLYQENFATGEDRITATFELIFLTGWAPAENQPKPLRPGSAQQRLADALGTDETKLPI